MRMIFCRKCPKCGFYHDFTLPVCANCQHGLLEAPVLWIDSEDIPPELYGELDDIEGCSKAFVQTCRVCLRKSFTKERDGKVTLCWGCHKSRIAGEDRIEYRPDRPQSSGMAGEAAADQKPAAFAPGPELITKSPGSNPAPAISIPDTQAAEAVGEESLNEEALSWVSRMRGSISAASYPYDSPAKAEPPAQPSAARPDAESVAADDVEDGSWAFLGALGRNKQAPAPRTKDIVLHAAGRYGPLSFAVKSSEHIPYLLGRSANQSEYLSQDLRVGNEHCFLLCREGRWYVKDNHSSNGTAVNGEFLDPDGESPLADGDVLMLGHHADSVTFRIELK